MFPQEDYQKVYETADEDQLRMDIFVPNYRMINAHNELYDKGEVTFYMKLYKFADWTPEEINTLYGKYKLWFAPSMASAEINDLEK